MTQAFDTSLLAQAPVHMRAILAATQETLGLLFDTAPAFGQAKVCPALMPHEHEVNVIVGFTGGIQGQMLFGMSKREASALAGILLMEDLPEWGDMTASGMAEIANIVAGGCATALHQHGFVANITVPSVIAGEHVQITWPNLFILDTSLVLPRATIGVAVGVKVNPR